MKKILPFIIILALISCSMGSEDMNKSHEEKLDRFTGKKTVKLVSDVGEGDVRWDMALTEGTVSLYYSTMLVKDGHLVTAGPGKPEKGRVGYREGNTVSVTFVSREPASGKLMISTN